MFIFATHAQKDTFPAPSKAFILVLSDSQIPFQYP